MKNERILSNAVSAVADFNSPSIDLTKFDSNWSIQVTRSLTDGFPTVTVECSNDNVKFEPYKDLGIDVSVPEIIIDDEFKPRFLRCSFKSNGATGTVTIKLYKDADSL